MVELVKNKWTIGLVLITIVLSLSVILLGNNIKFIKNNPKEVYAVYLDGKKIGVVSSVDDFNGYINEQENKLKEKLYILLRVLRLKRQLLMMIRLILMRKYIEIW